jgi:hypothetical protein
MKLIITEEQYRLIIENEESGNLFFVPEDILRIDNGIGKMLKLYNMRKESKGWNGIKVIGDLNFYEMDADSVEDIINFVKEVVYIGGMLVIPNGEDIEFNFSKLKVIGDDLKAADIEVIKLPELEIVKGIVNLKDSGIEELPKLKRVDGYLNLTLSGIRSLPELEYVGSTLGLRQTEIEDLPKLKYVGNVLSLMGTPFTETTTEEELRNKIEVKGQIQL